MKGKLIIDGNAIYEIDEECMRELKRKNAENEEGKSKGVNGSGCRISNLNHKYK